MSAAWWVRRGDVVDGPFTVDQLKQMAGNGNLDRKAPIRLGKTTKWVEAQRMGWLCEYFETTSQTVTDQIPTRVPSAPVAPPDLSSGFTYPWYLYAIIGTGTMIVLVLVLLLAGLGQRRKILLHVYLILEILVFTYYLLYGA